MTTVTSITFDKTTYTMQDTVTMTVKYTSTAVKQVPSTHNVSGTVGAGVPQGGAELTNFTTSFETLPGTVVAPDPYPPIVAAEIPVTDNLGNTVVSEVRFQVVSNIMNSYDSATNVSTWTAVLSLPLTPPSP